MTKEQIAKYEQYLKDNEDKRNTRIFGSYLDYLDSYLHDRGHAVDGMSWERRMKEQPMPMNVYLYA